MKILIDTNIVLDVMLKREPFYKLSLEILSLTKKDDVEEYVSASAITDIYYIAYRQLRDKGTVKKLMKEFLTVAYLQEMDGIVTRNPSDYKEAKMKVWKPEELLL